MDRILVVKIIGKQPNKYEALLFNWFVFTAKLKDFTGMKCVLECFITFRMFE